MRFEKKSAFESYSNDKDLESEESEGLAGTVDKEDLIILAVDPGQIGGEVIRRSGPKVDHYSQAFEGNWQSQGTRGANSSLVGPSIKSTARDIYSRFISKKQTSLGMERRPSTRSIINRPSSSTSFVLLEETG